MEVYGSVAVTSVENNRPIRGILYPTFYMKKMNNRLRWGIFGGIAGGLIAIIGFWILSPQTDSVVLFVMLRVVVGAIVAMIIGPIVTTRLAKNKSE